MKIQIGDKDVPIGLHKGPGLVLPADLEIIECVLGHLNEFYDVLLAAGRGIAHARKEAIKDGTRDLLSKSFCLFLFAEAIQLWMGWLL